MENMKSLADKIREATKTPEPPKSSAQQEKKVPEQKKTETEEKKQIPAKRKEVQLKKYQKSQKPDSIQRQGISIRINELSFEDDSFESITIRFPKKLYSKLKLLSNEKLSVQKTTIYAVNELLQSDEIKQKLKNILKSLNE